jgi:dipeptidyl aminopeptidase/acylaminoacyl peptidase
MLCFLAALALTSDAAAAAKKPLDHTVYDGWKAVRGTALSDDGKWACYGIAPQIGDAKLYIYSTSHPILGSPAFTIDRGSLVRFSDDSRFAIITQAPPYSASRAASAAGGGAAGRPAAPGGRGGGRGARNAGVGGAQGVGTGPVGNLVIIDLNKGTKFEHARVPSTRIAEHDNGYIAYQLAPEPTPPPPADDGLSDEDQRGQGRRGAGGLRGGGAGGGTSRPATWVIRNLATGRETTLSDVTDFAFDRDGTAAAYVTVPTDKKKAGISWYDFATGKSTQVTAGPGRYLHLAIANDGRELAFESDNDAPDAKPPVLRVYTAEVGGKPKEVAKLGDAGLPKDWAPADSAVEFSEDGHRLFFNTSPKPVIEMPDTTPADEKAQVDIWTWKDARLQSQQIHDVAIDNRRTYRAVVDLRTGKDVQLTNPDMASVEIGDKNRAAFGLGRTTVPYELESSWDGGRSDLYRVNIETGEWIPLPCGHRVQAFMSPNGANVSIYDEEKQTLTNYDLTSGASHPVKLPKVDIINEETDTPTIKGPYGIGPFTSDGHLIVRDQFDLWAVDTSGKGEPNCLTNGFGRRWDYNLALAPSDTNRETGTVDFGKTLLIDVRSLDDESTGIYTLSNGEMKKVVYGAKGYAVAAKAKNAETLVCTESSFAEYPDVWVTDTSWSSPTRISDANPQQANYAWGTCELVNWIGNDGQHLKGLLYLPENLDRSKKYPMITYYYERNANTMYSYHAPAPSASTINISEYVSNGYIIFVPDIDYRVGYPGQSAVSAILPGVQSLLTRSYIDAKHLGLQGQSWGGYQTAFLVTQTNMFACAEAGAPVGDMFSAYGGIRDESGVVREGQYEHGQSRIGGTPWDHPLQYIENSPVFWADKVETPLMIMSNDADGAVPHTQGIELFTDLRRLGKPSWMVVYNGEQHNLVERRNRKDLSIRLQQFFDHYLKGAEMPVWMSKGVPAVKKGKDYGFDLDPTAK